MDEVVPGGTAPSGERLRTARDIPPDVLRDQLQRAIGAGELRLHYQPIIHLGTDHPVGVEALLRWEHPELGLLLPRDFLPLAEREELIRPVGYWVLDEACRQVTTLPHRGRPPITVAVNLSLQQVTDRRLGQSVERALSANGCDPALLCFEVNAAALADPSSAGVLRHLQELGTALSLDEFGIGDSSLSKLKQVPANALKIHSSFVRDLASDSYDAAIVASIVSLAREVKVQSIAEGVETTEQLFWLRKLGADEAQGYALARPMAADDLLGWLSRRPGGRREHLPNWNAS